MRGYNIILAAVRGYYDGTQIIVNEDDRKNLCIGDELVITISNNSKLQGLDAKTEERKRIIELGMYVKATGRTEKEIDNYIRG